jgi:PAS domain-containing protein
MNQLTQNTESHELSDALEKLSEEAARLQTVIDTVPSILWTSFPDGSKEYLNKRWYEYTGLTQPHHARCTYLGLSRQNLPSGRTRDSSERSRKRLGSTSSSPSSRDLTRNGKYAPSTYLRKQLDVTEKTSWQTASL